MINDVIIIGGGASGLCAAIMIKKLAPQLSVRVLEALPRVCKKLSTTGNGRCNITNRNITADRYHGENKNFCLYALEKYNVDKVAEFFSSIGVPFVFEGDKAYPSSLQASSVVDCLRFAAEDLGVIINTETKVNDIQVSAGRYRVISRALTFIGDNVIMAAGLLSGGDKLGCDGSMLQLLKKSGFKTVKTTPAIVQIKTNTDIVKQLKGIKVNANVTLKTDNKILRQEFGETLFCDYGLSGPPILQVSGLVSKINEKSEISLDLMPETQFDELYTIIKARALNLNNRKLEEFFTGMLHKRVGQVILKLSGLSLMATADSLTDKDINKIAATIKNMRFEVTGTTGFVNSQVTSGGLDTRQFDEKTMMSKDNKGFYAIGEILDIDGDCGGFNLQWAWSSAMAAANSIANNRE